MMDTKRTVLWIIFGFSLLLLWDNWMRYNGQASMFSSAPAKPASPAAGKAAPNDVPANATVAPTAPTAATPAAEAAPVAKSERIEILTDVVKAAFDTAGGELVYLELLKHRDTIHPEKNVVLFDKSLGRTYLGQTGLTGGVYPNHRSMYVARPGARELGGNDTVQLVMDSEQGGVKLTKTFIFHRGDYTINVRHDITNLTAAPITPSLYLQLVRDGGKLEGESQFYSTFTGPAVYTDAEKFHKLDFEDIAKGKAEYPLKSDDGWIAMIQHYFVSAFVPPENAPRNISATQVDNNLFAVANVLPLNSIAPGATASMDAKLYSGPQETSRLEQVAPALDTVKDYGLLKIVAEPIFWLMDQIHKVLGNWGWTIIALTVLIKLVFYPLSAASYKSMAKMKLVTPKMTAIRERHKGDPQKMNQAMMELYRSEKVNPFGGCLPILVQIPVFIALYWVLLASVEMRNAPWLGWIQDLAAPDPFYILPILMAVSMFIQTKLNPTPPDPIQAKVMLFMP
ncbi:MAG: yidC, partial [Paucimonas sp.]|nr:yidC [Paucimonas sp.]